MARTNGRKQAGGRFAHLPIVVLESAAVTSLSHATFRVLVLLTAQFSGFNNGALGLTATQAAKAGIASDRTLYKSLRELEDRRLIRMTYHSSRIPPRPTMWEITWRPLNDTPYTRSTSKASHSYREWRPSSKVA